MSNEIKTASCSGCGYSAPVDTFDLRENSFDMMGDELICPKCPRGGCVDILDRMEINK